MEEKNKQQIVDFYISCSLKDTLALNVLKERISEAGLTCFSCQNVGLGDFFNAIPSAIKGAKAFIALVSKNYVSSKEAANELMLAYNNGLTIFPIFLENVNIKGTPVEFYLGTLASIYVTTDGNYKQAFDQVIDIYKENFVKKQLFEKLSEYIKINHTAYIYRTIAEIIPYLPQGIDLTAYYADYADYFKTISILKTMSRFVDNLEEDFEARKEFFLARSELRKIIKVNQENNRNANYIELINLAFYLYLLIESRSLDEEAIDIFSSGRANFGFAHDFIEEINTYAPIFSKLFKEEADFLDEETRERDLVLEVKNLLSQTIGEMNSYLERRKESVAKVTVKAKEQLEEEDDDFGSVLHFGEQKKKVEKPLSELEKQLFEVAEYIHNSNIVFTKIAENKPSHEFLMCLKTSYERLKNYCEIVGCKEVSAYCIEKISEINIQLERANNDNGGDDVKENGFKALLGFSLPFSGRYDAFISYKHEDENLASKVYDFLKENLLNVFFDKVTLPKLGNSEYHKAIMDSLDKSQHFIVILSDLSYLKSHWVDLEMKTFEQEMVEGRKPGANFVFVVTPEVFDEIKKANKACIPIQYRNFEMMTMVDYKERLLSYIKPNNGGN